MDTGCLGDLGLFCRDSLPVYRCEPRSGESRPAVAERAVVELHRGEVAERGVPAPAVIERLDVLEHRDAGFGLGRPRAAVDEVLLDRGMKALQRGVVETAPFAPIETSIPTARPRRVKISDVYCPRSTGRRNKVCFRGT